MLTLHDITTKALSFSDRSSVADTNNRDDNGGMTDMNSSVDWAEDSCGSHNNNLNIEVASTSRPFYRFIES